MLNFRWSLIVLVAVFVAPPTAWAHFLWLARDARDSSQVKVYFSEVAEPDSPDLLDRVKKAQVWALTDRRGEPQLLPLSQKDDALVTALPVESARATVVLHHTYGVMTRGDNTFLLKYYSKAYASPLPGTWRPVNDGERLPLEITPTQEGDNVVLGVTWKGEPAKDVLVTVLGPGVNNEESTNENGVVRCRWEEEGVYSIRARLIETTQGEFEGKAYTEARHYSTLALHFAPKQIAPVAHNLPDLPQGITSLGAAISGDTLYLYGGNYGQAHEYSRDGQSGDLWKLNVKQPTQWERLPGGPKLQGLAMVEYQGMIYRVGGFTAMNQEGEPQDLRSQPDFARFDPRKQAWEELPAMPEPRSSHDAAVLDGILYVVGGWSLRGKDSETKWHDTALAIDLKSDPLQWKPIAAPPFYRRALAVAAWNGKIYCLGGMQQKGGPTTAVAVYDPAKDVWSEGPALLGGAMDGFGASAFACGGALYATTITGSIQRLSGEGKGWEYVGQLEHPRFFHRLLPLDQERLVAVGGGSMSVGKIVELEVIPVAKTNQHAAQ